MKRTLESESGNEKARLQWAIRSALSVPLLDDIQGFTWEAVFHFVKGLKLRDPLREGKTKRLFDAVDSHSGVGWSLKALQVSSTALRLLNREQGPRIEFVIQRADIFKKARKLGFPRGLTRQSRPSDLGRAIVRHWNAKLTEDMEQQGVTKPKLAMLLKSKDRRTYSYFEQDLLPFDEGALAWEWAAAGKLGLQGKYHGQVSLKWYQGQKQLFQCLTGPAGALSFSVEPGRIDLHTFVAFIAKLAGL